MSEPEAQELLNEGVLVGLIQALSDTLVVLNNSEERDRHWSAAMLGRVLSSAAQALMTVEAAIQRRVAAINRLPP